MTEVTNWKRNSSRVLRANKESRHYWSMPPGFRYPVEPSPRIVFYDGSGAFQPELEAAETAALPANLLGVTLKSVWRPRYGLVVFTGQGCGSLTEHDRDEVWRVWGVPVFEHMLDFHGSVAAEECDAHSGLHLRPGIEWRGDLLRAKCECGLETPRIPLHATASEWAGVAASSSTIDHSTLLSG
jgi:hypothetical protein